MTPWRPSGVPDWEALQAEMPQLWTKPQWLRGVFVDNRAVPELPTRSRYTALSLLANGMPISADLVGLLYTSWQSVDCPKGQRFGNSKEHSPVP